MSLVSHLLRAHGGSARWNELSVFSAHVSIGGALLPAQDAAAREFVIEGETRRPRLKMFNAAEAGRYAVYTPGRVETRTMSHQLIDALDEPIAALAGRPLGDLERLFLMGNTLWSAIAGPFPLEMEGAAAMQPGPRRLTLDLPDSLDPLCPRRLLHVGEDGTLHRQDGELRHIRSGLVADTLSAPIIFDGILIATLHRRHAIGVDGRIDPAPLLDIEIFDARFS